MTGSERYGVNAPLIGPCDGDCGTLGRARIKPCYPTQEGWVCHDCIQTRQRETATRLQDADAVQARGYCAGDVLHIPTFETIAEARDAAREGGA